MINQSHNDYVFVSEGVCDTNGQYRCCFKHRWVRCSRGSHLRSAAQRASPPHEPGHLFSVCTEQTAAHPHQSWRVSFSTEACRWSEIVWVLCRTSLSSWSCFRESASSPCTVWNSPSRIWTCWKLFFRSASQRWSFSSRSMTRGGERSIMELSLTVCTMCVQLGTKRKD